MESIKDRIDEANSKVVERILSAQPTLIDIKPALEVVPGMTKTTILHAGPPIEWERMCSPMRGAVLGALIYEGLAENPADAEKVAASGSIQFSPCHHHSAVGSMTGITSASMPVVVVENRTYGNKAYCALAEKAGAGKALTFGSYSDEAIEKCEYSEKTIMPVLQAALKQSSGINLKSIIAQALNMGDECHNRNVAASLLFLKEIVPLLLKIDVGKEAISKVLKSITENLPLFFTRFSFAACKATMDAAHGIEYSTIVTTIARNGVDAGIRVSGLGDEWFTAPATQIKGRYFLGYSDGDANPDLGDSAIAEAAGIGGFAMAAAPAITQLLGASFSEAMNYTRTMAEITVTKNGVYAIPALDFEGSPTGIDIRKVVETGITPVLDTAIAHKNAGVEVGEMIGVGITNTPLEMYKQALKTMAEKLGL